MARMPKRMRPRWQDAGKALEVKQKSVRGVTKPMLRDACNQDNSSKEPFCRPLPSQTFSPL